MASSANLPAGAFITSLGGKRCTAIPKANNVNGGTTATTTATTATSVLTSSSTSTSSSSSSSSSTSSSSSSTSTSSSSSTTSSSSTSTSTSTSIAAQETTAQATAPAVPPAAAPVVTDTSTTAAAAAVPQQTIASTTSSTTNVPNGTQSSAVAPVQTSSTTSSTVTAAPPSSPTVSTSLLAAPPTSPESALQSQVTQTDNNLVPTTSETVSLASQVASGSSSAAAGNAALVTTIGTGTNTNVNGGQAAATIASTTATNTSVASSSSGDGMSTQTTVAVVGGVIGGVVSIALVAFLVWFWRKRIRQKRRSTLLTPLGPELGFGSAGEKVRYAVTSRDSIGPTTAAQKLKAFVGMNSEKIRGRFGGHSASSSVNLNRGNSQYMEGSSHSRNSSTDYGTSAKDRLLGFFGRFNDKARGEREGEASSNSRGMTQNKARSGSQPDFLTLLSMDDKQLAAQANKNRASMSNPRRSQSAGSNDHFLGSLNLGFDTANPFSDNNAMDRDSAKVAPLTITNPDNPFSDANAVQQPSAAKQSGPATYVQNIRRSRGTSVGGAVATRPPSTNAPSVWRESGTSVASFATRRNKFRSDPFDLDRPELLSSSASSQMPLPYRGSQESSTQADGAPLRPNPAHTRKDSNASSKYSSGVTSVYQWSDPGPDVGPGTVREEGAATSGRRKEPGQRKSGASQGSQGSVGKAY